MLSVISTPNHAGVKISGDYFDLDELNHAIYQVIGEKGKFFGYEGARARILKVAYRIRQAAQGDANVEFVFNALTEPVKKKHRFIAPDRNIYYSAEVLWPEVLFAALALKDFAAFYTKEAAYPKWNLHLHVISKFQALVLDCLRGHVHDEVYELIQKAFDRPTSVEEYAIQYIDLLNVRYIDMTRGEREQSLPAIAMKIARPEQDYLMLRNQLLETASSIKRPIHDIPLNVRYPEEIDW